MDAELEKLVRMSMLKSINNGRMGDIIDVPETDDLKYTSLRDIIPNSPTYDGGSAHDANSFDSSNITIRNQLVKQAASAYLQSAAVLATRNQNCLSGMWRKATSRSSLRSFWRVYLRNPLRACFGYIVKKVCSFMAYVSNQIGQFSGVRG